MPNLNIEVKNKIAIGDNTKIVCDNSDYIVNFNLDQEWDNFSTKTMRVRYSNNEYTDYVFNGTSCKLPVITDKSAIEIGLYAGNLHTTSGAAYECIGSILGGAGTQVEPAQNIYNQIIQLLDDLDWSTLPHKPFETIGTGLEVNDQGVLFNTGAGGSFNIHELSEAKVISNDDEIPVYMVAENRTKKILWKTIEAQLKTSFDGFYAAIKHNHTVNDITDFPTIPTKTSDLENDSGFITSLDIPAVLYTEQVLTPDQQAQARTNIGAGQPVFAVNVTKVSEGEGYTADKTAAEIEAAYQAGRTIVCKTQAQFWIASIPVELPLVSRMQERDFVFAADQLMGENGLFTMTVNISDSGVEANTREVEIYKKPASGIPKSDLAEDVQTSLTKADSALQSVPDTYRTAEAQNIIDETKQTKTIADAGGYFGANPTVEGALQQLGANSGGGSGNPNAVLYIEQTLTNEQKAQARSNINAEEAGTSYTKSEIDTKLDEKINASNGKFKDSLSATTDDGTQLYQESMRVGGLGTGNCVSINKTSINFYDKSGTLGLNVDASKIHNLKTPSDDRDAANKKYVDDAVAGIIVPTKTSELTNDSGFITSAQGVENAGKFLVVGNDGNITLKTLEAWQGGNY